MYVCMYVCMKACMYVYIMYDVCMQCNYVCMDRYAAVVCTFTKTLYYFLFMDKRLF